MNDAPLPPPPQETAAAAADRADAAAIRRRWITMGEIVGIAGLLISALALWNSYADRRTDEAERQAEAARATRAQSAVILTGTPRHGGDELALSDPAHPVQSVTVSFPSALGVAPQSSVPNPIIAARWFAKPLIAHADQAQAAQRGRLPVLIAADYWQADAHVVDRAIYDIVWRSEGRVLRGRVIRLEGLILRERGKPDQARLDRLWPKIAAAPKG